MNTYKEGQITFKELNISWNLYTTEKNEHGEHEVFYVVVEDKNKHKIRFDFNNSIMEYGISKLITECFNLRDIKNQISKKFSWGGYDDVKTMMELRKKRIERLLYSILNCMASDSSEEFTSFKDFCDTFGYNDDSIKDKKLYHKVIAQYDELNSLDVDWSEWDYIREEDEKFNKELKKVI